MPHEPRWRRYRRFFGWNAETDVDDELAFHFEGRVNEYMAAGASRAEAEARARERFGDVDQARDELRTIGRRFQRRRERSQMIDHLRQDLRFAVRGLRRSPGLTITCIVTIALGVGANAAMFSLADRLFTRLPSGVVDPGAVRRLYVRTTWTVGEVPEIRANFTYRAFAALDSGLAPQLRLAAYTRPDTMPMVAGNAASTVHGAYVSSSFMSVLGVKPQIGRFFGDDEQIIGSPVNVAVISDRLWRREFDADATIIGKSVEINRQRMTVIGVAPRGFDGPDLSATEVWMPLPSRPDAPDGTWYRSYFASPFFRVLGRVSSAVGDRWINEAATTIARRRIDGPRGIPSTIVRDTSAAILVGPVLESRAPSIKVAPEVAITARLVGITVIVLLIACTNVANLLLARAASRRREIAVRIALGISRSRLVAQFVYEGVLLAAAAGAAALVVSLWAGNALRALIMPRTYWAQSAVDARVVVFIGLAATAGGIFAALIPALQTSRPELSEALKSGARDGGAGAGHSRLRRLLLAAQVAMSVLLLYGAGLFVHSLMRLQRIDLGFDADRVVYGSTFLLNPDRRYIDLELSRSPRVAQGLVEAAQRLATQRGVEHVALSTGGPMGGYAMIGLYLQDGTEVPRLDKRDPTWTAGTPSLFPATGMRLVRGRFFTAADRNASEVVVVNETAARTYWPQREALGQCLRLFSETAPCSTVIGVMRDSHVEDLVEGPVIQLVTPFERDSTGAPRGARYIVARAKPGQTVAVKAAVQRELANVFPTLAVHFVRSVDDQLQRQLEPWHVGLILFGGFGVLALVIAAVGTYSVVSYGVTQRMQEIGVRVALGANTVDVVRLIVGQGLRLAVAGVAAGLLLALGAGRVMQSLLYDTSSREPVVTIGVAMLLLAITALASAIPARRAAAVDPVGVLRAE